MKSGVLSAFVKEQEASDGLTKTTDLLLACRFLPLVGCIITLLSGVTKRIAAVSRFCLRASWAANVGYIQLLWRLLGFRVISLTSF